MKKKVIVGVVAAVAVVLVLGGFFFLNRRAAASGEERMELSEVQKVLTRDLSSEYPKTPREVVKFYNRIITCFYNEEYTDEDLESLGDQARSLLDEELLANNPRDQYLSDLRAEIEDYHDNKRTIANSTVCSSNEVEYEEVDGRECAYVSVAYFVEEGNSYLDTYETYVLRKDGDGNWKILVFYQTDGDDTEAPGEGAA